MRQVSGVERQVSGVERQVQGVERQVPAPRRRPGVTSSAAPLAVHKLPHKILPVTSHRLDAHATTAARPTHAVTPVGYSRGQQSTQDRLQHSTTPRNDTEIASGAVSFSPGGSRRLSRLSFPPSLSSSMDKPVRLASLAMVALVVVAALTTMAMVVESASVRERKPTNHSNNTSVIAVPSDLLVRLVEVTQSLHNLLPRRSVSDGNIEATQETAGLKGASGEERILTLALTQHALLQHRMEELLTQTGKVSSPGGGAAGRTRRS
ncbi:hypothetical protein O3P69_019009 [Scylla paramamosain]|uniref:Transmembrane protein n=1 Tax=Scylla paramamosain TaxID=85552 RepID=A0AAW0SDU7_SCYPA